MNSETLGRSIGSTLSAVILAGPARWLSIPILVLALVAAGESFASLAGADGLAELFHTVLGPFCHQRPERTLHIAGEPMALCARCFALYASLGVGLFAVPTRKRVLSLPEIPAWAPILAGIPMALDGGTQLIGLRESNNVLRVITGVLLGGVVAVFVGIAVNQAARRPKA